METFVVYAGSHPNGELEVIAISESSTEPPEDYFIHGVNNTHEIGRIRIDGDTHLLNDYITIH